MQAKSIAELMISLYISPLEQWESWFVYVLIQLFTPYHNNNKLTTFIRCTFNNLTEPYFLSDKHLNQQLTKFIGEKGALNDQTAVKKRML